MANEDKKSDIDKVLKAVEKEITDLERKAELSGMRDDFPKCNKLKTQLEIYKAGTLGIVPKAWKEFELKVDPEFAEYERLKEKFKKVDDE